MILKQKRHKSKKLCDSAKGQDCMIRSPVCNHNPETTVLCHKGGAGMATKTSDAIAAFGCSDCHSLVDGNYQGYSPEEVNSWHDAAIHRTQQWWLDMGYLWSK